MIRNIGSFALLLAAALLLSACVNLAPDYRRPQSAVPKQWPTIAGKTPPTAGGDARAIAHLGWRQFLRDDRLRRTVSRALNSNRNLRIAALDILTARARYRITGASLLPTIEASGSATFSRANQRASFSDTTSSSVTSNNQNVRESESVDIGFTSYELDFFGRVRNQRESALDTVLATAEARRSTQISLVAAVASAWLTLAADKQLLALARDTLENQRDNFRLVQRRHDYGVASGSDVANARTAIETARGDVAFYIAQVGQDRNALRLLTGTTIPDADLPGARVPQNAVLETLPAGIPSRVLTLRPDVLAAEYDLKAANADVGAARADFFPSINLTASTGWATAGLSNLFADRNRTWSFSPAISLPIFDAGRTRANLDLTKAQKKIQIANYEATIQTAFREVADALAIRSTVDERLDAQLDLVAATRRAYDLSLARYRLGAAGYLDTLIQQRTLYSAQQVAVERRLAVQTNLVTLYKVLGGGSIAGPEVADERTTAEARALD